MANRLGKWTGNKLRKWADKLAPRDGVFLSPHLSDARITGASVNHRGELVLTEGSEVHGFDITHEGASARHVIVIPASAQGVSITNNRITKSASNFEIAVVRA